MAFHGNFRTCQFFHLNPFDTMRFQYFALISTGMRGTHVHLPMKTLICGLKLNNRHGHVALWWVHCRLPWPNSQLFTLMLHDLKVYFLGPKIMKKLSFFNFKKLCYNYLPFISPFRAWHHWSRMFWVDMHSSSTSVEIYDFALASWVNVNKIIIFFTTTLCS